MTTTTTAWAHLPNARHIDAALADVKARPERWKAALREVGEVLREAPWVAAVETGRSNAWIKLRRSNREAVWRAVMDGFFRGATDVGYSALIALVAWDETADLLDLPPDVLRTMVDLAPEPVNHQAAMLLPWALVRASTAEDQS